MTQILRFFLILMIVIVGWAPLSAESIPVGFATKKAGKVSINIYGDDGVLVHQLIIGKKLLAGSHVIPWHGCDDNGRPLSVGEYTFKGLVSNVKSVWDGKVGNSSPSPGWEHLQYRTGNYSDVIAMPDGGLITLSMWGEHSRIIQYIDGTTDYPVRWTCGFCEDWTAHLLAGAVDDKYLYGVRARRAGKDKRYEVLKRWSLKDGVRSAGFNIVLNEPHGPNAPIPLWWNKRQLAPGYGEDPHHPMPAYGVCGLAHFAGKLYVPLLLEDRIDVYDTKEFKKIAGFKCPSPRRIALDEHGAIFVTSGDKVLRFDNEGKKLPPLVSGLDTPWGVDVSVDGSIYVTECGDTQQLKVYSPEGKLLRVFGRKGGHQGGRVSFDLLDIPLTVSVNDDGHIFIVDFGGQRIVILNPDFSLRKIIHGRMLQHALSVSEVDPSLVYTTFCMVNLWEYRVDYQTGASKLVRRWNSKRKDTKMPLGGRSLRLGCNRIYFRKWNDRTFGIQAGHGLVFEFVGDRILPRVKLSPRKRPWHKEGFDKDWVWSDKNMDGIMQKEECQLGDWPTSWCWMGGFVDDKDNLYIPSAETRKWTEPGVLMVPFEGLSEEGLPIYRWSSARWILKKTDEDKVQGLDGKLYDFEPATYLQDKAGRFFYVTDGAGPNHIWKYPKKELSVRKYSRDGKLLWKVGRRRRGRLRRAGDIKFCNNESGIVDDRYLFYIDYTGPINCWDTDGLFVGRIFSDLPEELRNEGETFSGAVFRHPENGKVYAYSGPDCTYRMSRCVVEGLEKIERFNGTVSVKKLMPPHIIKEGLTPWSILRNPDRITMDGVLDGVEWGTATDRQAPVDFYHNNKRAARCYAQWDDDALYVGCNIQDDTPAVNKSTGVTRWAGDQVELMLRAEKGTEIENRTVKKHTATEYQLEVGPDGNGKLGAYVILNGTERKGKFLPGVDLKLKIAESKKSYVMELRIPWSSLGDYRPKKGDKILWNMKIHWGTPGGDSVAYLSRWATGSHTNPKNWGVAIFE